MVVFLRSLVVHAAVFGSLTLSCGASFTAVDDGGAGDASSGDAAVGGDSSASDGSSSRDGGALADGGGIGVEAGSCTADAGLFGNIIKGCTNDISCVAVNHQVDCCGSMVSIGINHASRDAFNQDETAWEASCPACGCPASPTVGEDGKPCGPNGCSVACDNGKCRTKGQ